MEADGEFFTDFQCHCFPGNETLLLPSALHVKTQHRAGFVHRQLMGASQQTRPGCSARVGIHPQAASRWFCQQKLDTLPQDQGLKEWITSLPVTPANRDQPVFIRGMILLSTTNFTSYKVRVKNIFKNSTVQMERTMVNVKSTEVR